jgi:hypothetical protein
MFEKPGSLVRIIEDVRDSHCATGLLGIYEGNYPRMVTLCLYGDFHEFMYNKFVNGEVKFKDGRSVIDVVSREEDIRLPSIEDFHEYKAYLKRMGVSYWYVEYNPLIRLPDGSFIFGDECWWEVFERQDHTLQQAQQSLEDQKEFLRNIFAVNRSNED